MQWPELLRFRTDEEYIVRFRKDYVDRVVTTAEGVAVTFSESDIMHALCGKDSTTVDLKRAQRILWIRFVLTNQGVRDIVQGKNKNIQFIVTKKNYVIITAKTKSGMKFVTHIYASKAYLRRLYDGNI